MLTNKRTSHILVTSLLLTAGCASEEATSLEGAFTISPSSLDFGAIAVGTAATRTVKVQNQLDRPLTLSVGTTEFTPSAFTTTADTLTVPANGEAAFDVRFSPTDLTTFNGRVDVTGEGKTASVELLGTVPSTSCLAVSPELIQFGNVVVGTTATAEVVVRNCTSVDATVAYKGEQNVKLCTSAASDPSTFCIRTLDREIAADGTFDVRAGEEVTVEVQFEPILAGTRERGSFILAFCENSACEHEVRLDGLGIDSGLRCTPSLDFGQVSPGACIDRTISCENVANDPVGIESWELVTTNTGPSSEDFSIQPSQSLVLEDGDTVDIEVTYCPGELGEDTGTVQIATDNEVMRLRNFYVPLEGTGGGPNVEIFPEGCIDFGRVSTLAPVRRNVLVSNNGFAPVEIVGFDVDTAGTGAFTASNATPGVLAPGDAVSLLVEFLPTQTGPIESSILVRTNDPDAPEIDICVRGEGVLLPPCAFDILGAPIEFGDVPVGHARHRSVAVRNLGTSECLLSAVGLAPGTDPSFYLDAGTTTARSIPAGEAITIDVVFAPARSGANSGNIQLSISSPTEPFPQVRLSGRGADVAPIVAPTVVDFATLEPVCAPPTRTVRVTNPSSMPWTVSSIGIVGSGAFSLDSLPGTPATVAAGGTIEIGVRYDPSGGGSAVDAIQISGEVQGQPLQTFVALRGASATGARHVETFESIGRTPVDVLMVIDDTCSTGDEQAAMATNFAAFTQYASTNAIDYHVGITTASMRSVRGRLVHKGPGSPDPFSGPFSYRIITPQTTPTPETVYAANMSLGTNSAGAAIDESPMEASFAALSAPNIAGHNAGFLRANARLAILYVMDEPEQSERPVDFYLDYFESLKGSPNRHRLSTSAIAGPPPSGCVGPGGNGASAPRLFEAAERTTGVFESICTTSWTATMGVVGDRLFGYSRRFRLQAAPIVSSIEVEIDGAVVPMMSAQGNLNWIYDFSENEVELTPFAPLAPGADLEISYAVECL